MQVPPLPGRAFSLSSLVRPGRLSRKKKSQENGESKPPAHAVYVEGVSSPFFALGGPANLQTKSARDSAGMPMKETGPRLESHPRPGPW